MQHSITLIITTLIGAVFGALPTSDLDATQHSVLKEWAIPEERAIAHEWVDLSDDQTHTTYFHDAVAFASIADVHARDDDPTYKDGWKGPNIVKTAQCARDTMRFENLTGARGNGDAFLSDCTAMTKYVIERDAIWDLDGTTASYPVFDTESNGHANRPAMGWSCFYIC